VVDQLWTAIRDNEKWFDELHLNYEEALQRVADLEHDIVGADGDRALVENELRRCQHEMDDMVYERDQAQGAIHELQTSLAEVEAQLAATVDDYTSLLGSHGAETAALKLALFERDSQTLLQTEQIRLEADRVAKLESELKTTHLILASQEGEVATLKDKIGTMRFEANEKMFEARAEIDGLKRDVEAKDVEVDEISEELRVMREEQERGDRKRGEVSQLLGSQGIANDVATVNHPAPTTGRG
jgi:chromosome segregation ATPase